jgi:hypothetical protein
MAKGIAFYRAQAKEPSFLFLIDMVVIAKKLYVPRSWHTMGMDNTAFAFFLMQRSSIPNSRGTRGVFQFGNAIVDSSFVHGEFVFHERLCENQELDYEFQQAISKWFFEQLIEAQHGKQFAAFVEILGIGVPTDKFSSDPHPRDCSLATHLANRILNL